MKSAWLKSVVLAVTMVVSACGGTQEFPEQPSPETGGVQQLLPQCDENGQCPTGFSCPEGPGSTCRRGRSLSSSGQEVEQLLPRCDEQGLCPAGFYCADGTCRRGSVREMLPRCDDQGRCPTGYYCDGGTCRRGVVAN